MLNCQRVLEEFGSQISFFRLFSTSEDLSEQPGFPAGLKTSFWHATSTQIQKNHHERCKVSQSVLWGWQNILTMVIAYGYCADHCIHEKLCAAATWCDYSMELSWTGGYPQIIHFRRIFHCKPSILGYPHFRKPPYIYHIIIYIYIFITRISPVDECHNVAW